MTLGFPNEQGVGVHVLADDEEGLGVTTDIQSAPLADCEEVGPRMGADFEGLSKIEFRGGPGGLTRNDRLGRQFDDGAMLDLELLLEEFRQLDFADETQALAVFLFRIGQANLGGDAPDFGFFEFAQGKSASDSCS